jgi:hypothetical protein
VTNAECGMAPKVQLGRRHYSALRTPHSALRTPNSAFRTVIMM